MPGAQLLLVDPGPPSSHSPSVIHSQLFSHTQCPDSRGRCAASASTSKRDGPAISPHTNRKHARVLAQSMQLYSRLITLTHNNQLTCYIRDEKARMKVTPPLAVAPITQEDGMR